MFGVRLQRYKFVAIMALVIVPILVACKPVTVVEVTQLAPIASWPGLALPPLPEKVDVVYSNGRTHQVEVSWDVSELTNKRLWNDTTVSGVVIDKGESIAVVTQSIEVMPSGFEVAWSGIEVNKKTQDELRAVLFRANYITGAINRGAGLRVDPDDSIIKDGTHYCRVNDSYFPTYADFIAFIEATYTGELLTQAIGNRVYIQVNGKFYGWPDMYSSLDEPLGPKRVEIVDVSSQRIVARLSETFRSAEGDTFDRSSLIEFLLVDGRWLVSRQ